MANVLELLIRARDEASAVLDKVGETGERVAQGLRDHWMAVTAAGAAAGVAFETIARAQAPLTESTRRLALALGTTEESVRDLASELADVSSPMSEVLSLMEQGRRQGIRSAEALEEYVEFWDMVSDATGEGAGVLAEAGIALRAVGIAAGQESEAVSAFGFVTRETTSTVEDFLRFLQLTGPEIRDMGLDVNEAAAVLGILEREFGMAGRTAMREFREAITESGGSMKEFLSQLRISPELFARYTQKVGESSTVLAEQAEIHAESYTWMQRLQHGISELTYGFGAWIGKLSVLSPLLMAMGPVILGVVHAKHLWATATAALAAAKKILLGPIGLILGLIGAGGALIAGLFSARKATEDVKTATDDLAVSYGGASEKIPPLNVAFRDLTQGISDQDQAARALSSTAQETVDELITFYMTQAEARPLVEGLTSSLDLQSEAQERLRREATLTAEAIGETEKMDEAIERHVAAVEAANRLDAVLTVVRGNISRHIEAYNAYADAVTTAREQISQFDLQLADLWEQYERGELTGRELWEAQDTIMDQLDPLNREVERLEGRMAELTTATRAEEAALGPLEVALIKARDAAETYQSQVRETEAALVELHAAGKVFLPFMERWELQVRAVRGSFGDLGNAIYDTDTVLGEMIPDVRDVAAGLDALGISTGPLTEGLGRVETVVRGVVGGLELYSKAAGLVNAISFGPAIAAFGPIALVIAGVIAVLKLLGVTWEDIGRTMQQVGAAIVSVFRGVFDFIGGLFAGIWNVIRGILNFAIDGINLVIRLLNLIRIPDWVPIIGGFGINIPEIPRLHQGGVYRAPPGATEGLALLRHGEVVLPPTPDFGGLAKAIAKELKPTFAPNVTIISPAPMNRAEMIRAQRREIERLAMAWEGVR